MLLSLAILAGAWTTPTLCVDGLIVGTHENKKWRVASDKLPKWKNGAFQTVNIGSLGKKVTVRGAVIMQMSGIPYLDMAGKSFMGVLWSGPTPAFPRKIVMGGKIPLATQNVVRSVVAGHGFGNAVYAWDKYVTGDFDGDGKLDQLVQCSEADAKVSGPAGDWNLILLLPGGKSPVELSWQVTGEDEQITKARIAALADFDRDGVYDLAIGKWYLEGNSGELWSLRTAGPVKVVEKGS